jgi:flavorubredoxin
LKFCLVLSSFGWGGGAIKHAQEILGQTKLEVIGAIEVNGPPTENDTRKVIELADTLAKKIRES